MSLSPADPLGYAVSLNLGDPLGRVVSPNLTDPFGHAPSFNPGDPLGHAFSPIGTFGHTATLNPADPLGYAVCLNTADLKLQQKKELEYILSGSLCAQTISHCLGCRIRRSLWSLNV